MDRRAFLTHGAALAATGWLSACGGGAPAPSAAPPAPSPDPSGVDWSPLTSRIQGRLLRPGDGDYDNFRRAANARYDAQRPLAVLRCGGEADVALGLDFARIHRLRPIPRSGGHSYVGASTGDGLVIDLGPLDTLRLDGEVAVIGAGAKLSDVYAQLIAQGRCLPSGSCLSVGIAGITLGGGFGVTDRLHGLSCDALVGARLVRADGQILSCDAQQEPELLWGLRGGGAGQFGIVTELRMRTHALGPMTEFEALFAGADLPAVLAAWQAWPQRMPDWIWSQLVLGADGRGGVALRLWGVAVADEASLQPHWTGLLDQVGRAPLAQRVRASSYRQTLLGPCERLSLAQCRLPTQASGGVLPRTAMAASSDFFDRPLDEAGIRSLGQALGERAASGRAGVAVLNLMGGAIGRVAPRDSAFVHRQALFSAQYLVEYAVGSAAATLDEGAQWAHGMRQRMSAWSSGRAYQNYPDLLIADGPAAYYGANLERLRRLKTQHDPDLLFSPPQGLRPA